MHVMLEELQVFILPLLICVTWSVLKIKGCMSLFFLANVPMDLCQCCIAL